MTGTKSDMRFENYAQWMADETEARLYTESQHSGSVGPAKTLARNEAERLSTVTNLLDVGGGSGGFSITLAEKLPNLQVQILDFPNVCEVGRDFVAKSQVPDKVTFVPGNALESDFPDNQCAVLMSYLSSSISGDDLLPTYKKAFDATKPGGFIIIHDFMVEDDRTGPSLAALWALQHMVFTPGAVSITPSFLHEQLAAAGYTDIQFNTCIPGMTKLAIAVKPE